MGLSENTVKCWQRRYNWPIPKRERSESLTKPETLHPVGTQSPSAIVSDQLSTLRTTSTLNLAKYAAEASERAAEHPDKLGIARRVRDVSAVHSTLWPAEKDSASILQIGILIGKD